MNFFNFNEFVNQKQVLFNSISQEFKNSLEDISNEILKKSSNVYVVDKIEGNIVVCENLSTREVENIQSFDMPKNFKEGDCLVKLNGKFVVDEKLTTDRKNIIKNKFDRLQNDK